MNTKTETIPAFKLSSNVINIPKRHFECGFQNYEVNDENKKQFESCKDWTGTESITLTGKTGTGKTHLAISMLKNMPKIKREEKYIEEDQRRLEYMISRNDFTGYEHDKEHYEKILANKYHHYRKANCLFVSVVEMFVEINNCALNEGKLEVLNKYASNKNYDCICFDDLGAEKLTDAKRENLYYIIDKRYREMLPTIITSNFTINELSEVEPRIASRLAEMGKIVQFNGNDYRKVKPSRN